MYKIIDGPHRKLLVSPHYNYQFDKQTGFFARWGATPKEDPVCGLPEIADIEISTVCHQGCAFCYKANKATGTNMDLATFQQVFEKLPPSVTQIAFGLGSIDGNPDLWSIFTHCRAHGVIPNVTINGSRMTPERYAGLAKLCGAVAVSRYDPDTCYNAVAALSEAGLEQVNIHQLVAEETFTDCLQVLNDAKTDPRLKGLRSIVLLALKPVQRGTVFTSLAPEKFQQLVDRALELEVGFGFDSCSAPCFLKAVAGHPQYKQFEMLAEPCESTLFSIYIDVNARMFPCSFLAGGFEGIDLLTAENFLADVWNAPSTVKWREELLATTATGIVEGCRQCPVFNIYGEVK